MSQGFTNALTLPLPVASGGTGVTTSTGTGSTVLNTSPSLVTPILGTPTSGTLTNCTGLPLTTGVTGVLPVANGGTGVAGSTFYVNTANTNIIALSLVKFSNVVNDSASAYSTSTGLYTIPTTGWYIVAANIKTNNYNYGNGAIIQIDIRRNSLVIAQQIVTPTAYNSTSCALNAGTTYYFTAGDTVSVYAFSNLAGASTTLDNSITNNLSINFFHT